MKLSNEPKKEQISNEKSACLNKNFIPFKEKMKLKSITSKKGSLRYMQQIFKIFNKDIHRSLMN